MNKLIDHTLLKPDASVNAVRKLCEEALEYKFASVCVNPYFVPLASKLLKGSMYCNWFSFRSYTFSS